MTTTIDACDRRRRGLLSGTFALAASAATLGTTSAARASNGPQACWRDEDIDAFHGRRGHLRVARYVDEGRRLAVPVLVRDSDELGLIDLTTSAPFIRLGTADRGIEIGAKGLAFKHGGAPEAWSTSVVKRLLQRLRDDETLRRGLFGLRAALAECYPEYLLRTGAGAPRKLGAQRAKSARAQREFGRSRRCTTSTVTETITTTVTRTEQVVLTAAEQFARCSEACFDRFLAGTRDDAVGYAICEAGCLARGFVDVVTGTIEVLETLVEQVVREVITCVTTLVPGQVPHPIIGAHAPGWLPGLSSATGAAATAFPPEVTAKAIEIVTKLVKTMPGAIRCLVEGQWSITSLGDLSLRIPGVESVPLGVTVCMDHDCALKLLGAGLSADAFAIISALIELATSGGVAAAVVAAGVTGAAAAALTQAILVLLTVLIVVMIHLVIVSGEIAIYESLGAIDNGLCITHPSLAVAVAGAINPLAGMVALGNVPLIVTPR